MSVPALVQETQVWPGTSSSTTVLAFAGNVLADSRLVAVVAWNSTTETCSVADNSNGAWTAIGSPQNGAGTLSAWRFQFFVSPPSLAGAVTVTATFTAALTGRALAISEYSGIDMTANPVDSFDYDTVNSAGFTSAQVTTSYPTVVLVGGVVVEDSVTGVGATWVEEATPAEWAGNCTADKIVFATGTYATDFQEGFAMDNVGGILALKGADDPNADGIAVIGGRLPLPLYRRARYALGPPQAVDAPQAIVPPLLTHLVAVESRSVGTRGLRRSRYRIGAPKAITAPTLVALNQERITVQAVKRRPNWRPGRGAVGRPQVVLTPSPPVLTDATVLLVSRDRPLRITRRPSYMLGFPGAVIGPQSIVNIELRPVSAPQPDVRRTRRAHSSLGAPQAVNPFVPAQPPVDVTVNVTLAGRTRANLARRRVRSGVGPPQALNPRAAVLVPIKTKLVRRPAVKQRPTHWALRPPRATFAVESCSAPVGPITSVPSVTASNVLGCGTYQALVLTRGGHELVAELPWAQLSWSRVLNDTSQASVTGGTADDPTCCGTIQQIRPWRHELAIYRDDVLVWIGPVVQVRTPDGQFKVDARDLTAWWDHRRITINIDYTSTDLSIIFQAVADNAIEQDDSPNFTVSTTGCGVLGTRHILHDQHVMAGPTLRDLSTAGIDYTAVARQVLAGGLEIPTGVLGLLADNHFVKPPTPVRDGTVQANYVGVRGAGGGAGGDPIYGEAAEAASINDDGLLATVDTLQTMEDINSAAAAAASKLALSLDPIGLEDCHLAPGAPYTMDLLVPGALFNIALNQTCIPINDEFRLQSITCQAQDGQIEDVAVVFQPKGTT